MNSEKQTQNENTLKILGEIRAHLKMSNFVVFVLTLTLIIFIIECPRHGRADDNISRGNPIQ